mgnify:CR=1 FL=1
MKKVICVNAYIEPHKREEVQKDMPNWVKEGTVYSIREILDNDGVVTGVLLNEVYNKPLFFKTINRVQEPAFGLFRFDEFEEEVLSEVRVEKLEKIE